MADAELALFDLGERLGVVKRRAITGENLDAIVLVELIEQMPGQVLNTALPTDAGALDNHKTISRIRSRSRSTPASVWASSASCPASFPAFANRAS